MSIRIQHIEYFLPEKIVTNRDLKKQHPDWDIQKVEEKSGVFQRHITSPDQTAYDLAKEAVSKLFAQDVISKDDIDGILFCTQSPDYIMPSNAFLIHKEFGFKSSVWAFDYNLACSGYIYGLAIARGFIETKMASNILLITADTYSRYINQNDRSTKVLFGDGAAVSLITSCGSTDIFDIELASEGREYEAFYIPSGGCKTPKSDQTKVMMVDRSGNERTLEDIHMNGFAVWKFISNTVPKQIKELLRRNKLTIDEIDFIGFHQASKLTLGSLSKALKIDPDELFTNLDRIGNTVSASIPIALKDAQTAGKVKKGDLILLSGFGVGLSWGSVIMRM